MYLEIEPVPWEIAVRRLLGYYEKQDILEAALRSGEVLTTGYADYCTNRAKLEIKENNR
jgi:hypothetical protein